MIAVTIIAITINLDRMVAVSTIFCDISRMTKKLDDAGLAAWQRLLVAHKMLIEAIERELALAVLPPLGWYDVLLAIEGAAERKLRMHELSDAIVLSRSNLTRLVDRMVGEGLLAREACHRHRLSRGADIGLLQPFQ